MAGRTKKNIEAKKDLFGVPEVEEYQTETREPSRVVPQKVLHVTAENIIGALNSAVADVNAVFQLRDHLQMEVNILKDELAIGRETRIENDRLGNVKREQEEFLYEFQIRKTRLERELKDLEDEQAARLKKEDEEHADRLKSALEEHKGQLKAEAVVQSQKLKQEREDHERKIKLEGEDMKRERSQLESEVNLIADERKKVEQARASLREELAKELNKDNEHALEVLKLNHLKEMEIVKAELRLEQASRTKFEAMLQESKKHIEKLNEQIATLSREALASASSASMASKLRDIITQQAAPAAVRPS